MIMHSIAFYSLGWSSILFEDSLNMASVKPPKSHSRSCHSSLASDELPEVSLCIMSLSCPAKSIEFSHILHTFFGPQNPMPYGGEIEF